MKKDFGLVTLIKGRQRLASKAAGFLLLAICFGSLLGCLRLSGSAGYTKIKDDEAITKTTGFDLDSSRLIDQRGVS